MRVWGVVKAALGGRRAGRRGRGEGEKRAWPWVNRPSLLPVWELILLTGATLLCIFYHVTYLLCLSVCT